jgi:NADH:ubiquinone oxidoreductase subunit
MVDKPPTEDSVLAKTREWEKPEAIPNYTATPAAFKTYSTYVSNVFPLGLPGYT